MEDEIKKADQRETERDRVVSLPTLTLPG